MEKITKSLPENTARSEVASDLGELKLRPLSVADASAFYAIQQLPKVSHSANIGMPYDSLEGWRSWIEKLEPTTVAIVAELGGTLVGHAEIYANRGRRAHSASIGVSVHDDWHGRGIGSRLIAELVDIADNWLGLRRLELNVFTDNASAIALYRKFGFEIEATFRGEVLRDGKLVDSHFMARLVEAVPLAAEQQR